MPYINGAETSTSLEFMFRCFWVLLRIFLVGEDISFARVDDIHSELVGQVVMNGRLTDSLTTQRLRINESTRTIQALTCENSELRSRIRELEEQCRSFDNVLRENAELREKNLELEAEIRDLRAALE